jgi:hypothetical protein
MTIRSSHAVQQARLIRQVSRLAAAVDTPAPSPARQAAATPAVKQAAEDIAARLLAEGPAGSFSTRA